MTQTSDPVTFDEINRRGLSDRVQEVLHALIGENISAQLFRSLETSEMEALGYGPSCPCGERGLSRGERTLEIFGEEVCAECAESMVREDENEK